MTAKEIFLELLKPDGRPERQLVQYEALQMVLGDPVGTYVNDGMRPGSVFTNKWGTVVEWPQGAPGMMPVVNDETRVIKDITRWRDYAHAPDIEAKCSDPEAWAGVRARAREKAGDERLVTAFMATGLFEQCHFLMPFEEVLTNLYDHPQEMHELIDCITEYKLSYAKLLIDNLQPDAIFSHDDWGTKDALFMKPEMWREFFKEPYRKLYGYIRDRGVIVIHHADSYLVPIVEDMAETGIQVWQGTLPENDIPALQERLEGRLVLMGGIGAAIDREDAGEEEVRSYVHDALHAYCPGGHFIPSITYGLPGAVFRQIDPWIDEEIRRYNEDRHLPRLKNRGVKMLRPVVLGTDGKACKAEAWEHARADTEKRTDSVFESISEALQDGSASVVVELVRGALDQGESAQDILTEGLVRGMNELGEDFSRGEVFVPEMLRAANCMSAATEILKPELMKSGKARSAGRVCLGTVKGDLHDIGKNLVKIMMEGSGLEVIDLGCDVSAEDFVQAAVDHDCDIIACSTLLTTSMNEIVRVAEAAGERGIRGKVRIMIGGAPVTQEFCEQAGADIYTPDAAAAARAAVSLLSDI